MSELLRVAGLDRLVPISVTNDAGSSSATDLGKKKTQNNKQTNQAISSYSFLMEELQLCHAIPLPFPHQRTTSKDGVRIKVKEARFIFKAVERARMLPSK